MKILPLKLALLLVSLAGGLQLLGDHHEQAVADAATLIPMAGKIRVSLNGELFTEYIYGNQRKPVLYPVIGPHGIGMTRNYPIKKGVKGEAEDHVHHVSLWFTHGEVNGVSFWHENANSGRIEHEKIVKVVYGEGGGLLRTSNRWIGPDEKTVCTDVRTLRFHSVPHGRTIDYEVTVIASAGDLTFGDT